MKKIRILALIISALLTVSLCSCFDSEDASGTVGTETDANGNVVTLSPNESLPEVEDEVLDDGNMSEFSASLEFSGDGCEISHAEADRKSVV